ncbi:MAG: rhomboid family intramembrane serine protease [Chitinophagales bacterium]
MENLTEKEEEKKRITVSLLIPLYFVSVLWLVYFTEYATNLDFSWLGILPRTFGGLGGIIFTPFLHGSFGHLLSNTVPLLVLGFGLIYFYRSIAYKVFLWIWFIDGLGVWILGRESYHIGASGLVYGMAAFLIFSGILRSNRRLLALSMAVVFVYGSLIWGMLPYIPDVSWEAHLFGFLAGVYFAVHYLRDGPANDPVPEWMTEAEEENDIMQLHSGKEITADESGDRKDESINPSSEIKIHYVYRSNDNEKERGD